MRSRIIAIILGVLLIVSVSYIIRQEYEERKREDLVSHLIEQSGKNEVVKHYHTDSVRHTIFTEKIIENNTEQKALAIGKTYVDSLQKALKISIDKMEQVSKVNAELTAKLQLKEKTQEDGTKVLTHSDKYLNLNYYPHSDSVDFAYNIRLNEVRYNKRKWLFGKKQHFIDVFADDPRVQINGLKSYRIRGEPPSRWGLGLHAGYGFHIAPNATLKPTPIVGLGINYNLIEF